jgi:hypothetical protein
MAEHSRQYDPDGECLAVALGFVSDYFGVRVQIDDCSLRGGPQQAVDALARAGMLNVCLVYFGAQDFLGLIRQVVCYVHGFLLGVPVFSSRLLGDGHLFLMRRSLFQLYGLNLVGMHWVVCYSDDGGFSVYDPLVAKVLLRYPTARIASASELFDQFGTSLGVSV